MSHFMFDDDMHETVTESRLCGTCQGDLSKCNGVCTGMTSIGRRLRSPEEIAKILADRRLKEEDDILRRADEIRARRLQVA
jgi:hypothetical protein